MWSLGCVFYELVTGKPLIISESETDHLMKIFKIFGTPNEENFKDLNKCKGFNKTLFPNIIKQDTSEIFRKFHQDELAYDLLKRLLILDPFKRIQAKECLDHPFFN